MRIFICDDILDRITIFKRRYIGHEIIAALNYQEALDILRKEDKFDFYSLDHDLESFHYEGGLKTEQTGTDIVKFIIKELPKEKWPDLVICHSWNKAGGNRMKDLLTDVGITAFYQPFGV